MHISAIQQLFDSGATIVNIHSGQPDQKKVIGLSGTGNHLVVGPPGSGKTNILLLRAKYMTLSM